MQSEINVLNFKPNYKFWLIFVIFYLSFCYLFYTSFFISSYNKLFHNINYGHKVIAVFFILFTFFMILIPIILFFFSFSINKIDLENRKIINIKYFGLKTKIIDFSQIQGIKIEYEHAFKGNFKQRILTLIIDSDEAISFSSLEITNFDEYLETLPKYFKFLRSENYDLTFYRYFELTDDEKKQLFKELEKEERSLILERVFHYSLFILFLSYIIYSTLENNMIESYEFQINQLSYLPLGVLLGYSFKRIIYYLKCLLKEDTYMYNFLRKNI